MATGEGVTRIPKGARRAQEAAGIDPSTGDFVDGTQDMGDPPAVDPVPIAQQQPPSDAAVPAAAPPPAPVSAPAVPDPIADLGLTFDDEPAPTAVTNDAALAARDGTGAGLHRARHGADRRGREQRRCVSMCRVADDAGERVRGLAGQRRRRALELAQVARPAATAWATRGKASVASAAITRQSRAHAMRAL